MRESLETARTGPDAERAADRTSASGFFTRYSARREAPDRADEKRRTVKSEKQQTAESEKQQTAEPEKRRTAEIEKRRTAGPVRWK